MPVTVRDSVVVADSPDTIFTLVDDLARYPAWTDLVARADPLPAGQGRPPAWEVDLRGRVGRLARSKRLRMVRTRHESPRVVVFERQEDGGDHGDWRLRVDVDAEPAGGSSVRMTFDYGGGLWGPVIERLLRDGIRRSKPRLVALGGGRPGSDPP